MKVKVLFQIVLVSIVFISIYAQIEIAWNVSSVHRRENRDTLAGYIIKFLPSLILYIILLGQVYFNCKTEVILISSYFFLSFILVFFEGYHNYKEGKESDIFLSQAIIWWFSPIIILFVVFLKISKIFINQYFLKKP